MQTTPKRFGVAAKELKGSERLPGVSLRLPSVQRNPNLTVTTSTLRRVS